MIQKRSITLCLPCRNEGAHLHEIIANVPAYIDQIVVISNASTDDTVEIAKKIGGKVTVVEDNRKLAGIGYGFAHMTGIQAATGDFIVGADGDGTYPVEDIDKVVRHMLKNKLDFVTCNRYPLQDTTKIPFKLRLGVNMLNWEVRLLYGFKIQDTLSGMWIFRREIADDLKLTMGDWNLSPQIKINAATNPAIHYGEYSIAQHQRLGETKQNYFKTGLRHAIWIFQNRFQAQSSKKKYVDSKTSE